MRHPGILLAMILGSALTGAAQNHGDFFRKFQVHGNVAQGFLFSSSNNYLTTESSDGSAAWTTGSLSVTRPVTDHFRVGAQAYSYRLGALGRQNVMLDWAYADYKFSSYFGIRGGKVKTPMGLFNDTQDVDAVHPWVLLPQAMYPADTRSFSLSHTGGVAYGEAQLSSHGGVLQYAAFGGRRSHPRNEGFALIMAEQRISLGDYAGPVYGFDLRWRAPIDGLSIGAAWSKVELDSTNSRFGIYPTRVYSRNQTQQMYAQYEKGKLALAAEWRVTPIFQNGRSAGEIYSPMRGGYVMASYRATQKVTFGAYYDQNWFFLTNRDRNDPKNHFKDVALSSRLDVNRFFYAKLEAHYIDGNSSGFRAATNPQGLDKVTHLLLARVGFTF